jgi:hypothetical protein
VANRIQISTDALAAYPDAIECGFGSEVDYAQVVKTYALTNLNKDAASIVEVFTVTGHPKVKHCYAWSHRDGKDDKDERFVAVLGLPPVDSPQSAVKVAIASEVKSKKLDKKPRS